VVHQETVEGHIADVEALVGRAFQTRQIDASAYADAVTALAESGLALARIGRGAAERPMVAASQAESRLYARWHVSRVVREAVRAAVAATLCLVDGNDPRGATAWLGELVRVMPRRELRPLRAWCLPPARATPAEDRPAVLAAWRSRSTERTLAARRRQRLVSVAS
jgi:hypothetical protein